MVSLNALAKERELNRSNINPQPLYDASVGGNFDGESNYLRGAPSLFSDTNLGKESLYKSMALPGDKKSLGRPFQAKPFMIDKYKEMHKELTLRPFESKTMKI